MPNGKPNILFIMGDDIGWFNLSAATTAASWATARPTSTASPTKAPCFHRLVRPAELHRRPRRLHHRPVADPHRADQGRPARRRARACSREDPTIAELLKPLGYATRPVRQEPSRRPRRVPAHHPRLRRILRQPLPPQRRGRARRTPTIRRTRSSGRSSARAASACKADCAKDGQKIERHRPADQASGWRPSTRSSSPTPRISSSAAAGRGEPFFCWFNSTRMHVFTHLKPEVEGKTGLGLYPDGMVEHDGHVGELLAQARRARHRRQHDRRLHHRQRRRMLHLARRRHDAVQGRKGDQLGRRLPRALRDPLAGRHQAGHDHQRHLRARGLPADASRPRPATTDVVEQASRRAERSATRSFKVHLDGYNLIPGLQGRGPRNGRARGFALLERRRRPDGDPRTSIGRSPSWSSIREIDIKTPLGVWQGSFT